MSNDGSFILGKIQGQNDREDSLPVRVSIPSHLDLSLSEEASWWAGYWEGYNQP